MRHNMVEHFIKSRHILDLCLEADWQLGARVVKRWWELEGIDLAGFWEEAVTGKPEEEEGSDNDKTV